MQVNSISFQGKTFKKSKANAAKVMTLTGLTAGASKAVYNTAKINKGIKSFGGFDNMVKSDENLNEFMNFGKSMFKRLNLKADFQNTVKKATYASGIAIPIAMLTLGGLILGKISDKTGLTNKISQNDNL